MPTRPRRNTITIAGSRRLARFESAKTSWGEDTVQTLMDLLPPDPDALATKAALAELRAGLLEKIDDRTRLLMASMLTIEVTLVVAVLGAWIAR